MSIHVTKIKADLHKSRTWVVRHIIKQPCFFLTSLYRDWRLPSSPSDDNECGSSSEAEKEEYGDEPISHCSGIALLLFVSRTIDLFTVSLPLKRKRAVRHLTNPFRTIKHNTIILKFQDGFAMPSVLAVH